MFAPAANAAAIDIEQVERASNTMLDEYFDRARLGIEGRHWRHDDRARLGGLSHGPEVAEMERRLPDHQNQTAPLLQHDISGARQQIRGRPVGDFGERAYRAR